MPQGSFGHRPLEVCIEAGTCHNPFQVLCLQIGNDTLAQRIHLRHNQWVHVRIDRVLIGRQEKPRTVRPHLVLIVHDFREPLMIQHLRDQLTLN